ncbi:hypothetical protein M409DRAFT_59322 [Zasmidium cellare ATCC 36951]|uniref:PH domain-containing protein n=1 Tax=Zasmidium cellare ATCC 36951 TaxID=1080233 RepID=A0A6A6C6F2_ZASCE|nr:uncharacterized protein M409DRAFT_59322 [Zasmidium cellare ATCC 36951]KAF2161329.1 hypothetical protein M409DRAFT_59322 [Zasmidium cellare ATCC 36951]
MAQVVGKYAANKFLKKQMKGYEGKKVETGDDPYFAMVEDPKRPGKLKKVKKQIPAYIPEHDAMILASVRRKAYRLDMCLFNFLGIRFGWEAVIGLIPVAGDGIGVFFALLVMKKAMQVEGGLDNSIKLRMLINIALDFIVGLVPLIGDLADAAFKCNTKNLRLLEVTLDKKYKPRNLHPDERDLVGVDKEKRRQNRQSGIYAPQDPPPATAFEDFSDEEEERIRAAERQASGRVQEPRPTRAPEDRRGGGGWFSSVKQGSRREQRPQNEMREARRQETGQVRR